MPASNDLPGSRRPMKAKVRQTWVSELAARHSTLVDKHFLEGLTPAEAMEKERIEGLLDAWEAWDLNGTETLLRFRLLLDSLEERIGG